MNHERESAISQLGVAYLETRELKAENEALRQENNDLKSQLNRIAGKRPDEQDTLESDASYSVSEAEDSQLYTERSGDMSRSTRDLTSKNARSKQKAQRQEDSRAKVSTQVDKEISRLEKERAEEALFSLDMPTSKRFSSKTAKYDIPRHFEPRSSKKQPNTGKQRVKRVIVEDMSEPLEGIQTKVSSEDLTLLSVIDVSSLTFHPCHCSVLMPDTRRMKLPAYARLWRRNELRESSAVPAARKTQLPPRPRTQLVKASSRHPCHESPRSARAGLQSLVLPRLPAT